MHVTCAVYKSDMEKDLKSDTSGDFMRLVVALSAGGRMESQVVNVQRAKEDATVSPAATCVHILH